MAPKEIVLCFLVLLISICAEATEQAFGPIHFVLPSGWTCQVDGQSMICLDSSPQSEKNAALVVTYKLKTAEDNLTVYRDQLSRPRILQQGDLTKPSQTLGIRELTINNLKWIEGIHLGSEVANYYTHYFATSISDIAILISISIEQSVHQEVLQKMQSTIDSFKINFNLNSSPQKTVEESPNITKAISNQNSPNPEFEDTGASQSHSRISTKINFFGLSIKRYHLFLGIGLIIVLGLMIYALRME